jgi:hypothetical protein
MSDTKTTLISAEEWIRRQTIHNVSLIDVIHNVQKDALSVAIKTAEDALNHCVLLREPGATEAKVQIIAALRLIKGGPDDL